MPCVAILAEFGLVTGNGRENVDRLRSALERDEEAADNPVAVHHMAQICFAQIDDLSRRIAELDVQIAAASRRSRFSARLQTMPGVGPITSMALVSFGAPKKLVIGWQTVSIILWGAAFGLLAMWGVDLLAAA